MNSYMRTIARKTVLWRGSTISGPVTLDVTDRNVEDISKLQHDVAQLKEELREKDIEVHRIAMIASLSVGYIDQLRLAKRYLDDAGLDSSFIDIRKAYHKE